MLLASQIATDPKVRAVVREAFFERAKLTVRPTKRGQRDIDESHDVYALKFVTDKPVNSLFTDQWLRLEEAEKQKLLTLSLADDIDCFPYQKGIYIMLKSVFLRTYVGKIRSFKKITKTAPLK